MHSPSPAWIAKCERARGLPADRGPPAEGSQSETTRKQCVTHWHDIVYQETLRAAVRPTVGAISNRAIAIRRTTICSLTTRGVHIANASTQVVPSTLVNAHKSCDRHVQTAHPEAPARLSKHAQLMRAGAEAAGV